MTVRGWSFFRCGVEGVVGVVLLGFAAGGAFAPRVAALAGGGMGIALIVAAVARARLRGRWSEEIRELTAMIDAAAQGRDGAWPIAAASSSDADIARLGVALVGLLEAVGRRERALCEADGRSREAACRAEARVGELEATLKARTAQLELTNRELESFGYSVSHDLRAPLRVMEGFSQALIEDYGRTLDPTAMDFAQRIRQGANRLSNCLDGLLHLSRVTRGALTREDLDVSGMARAIVKELEDAEPDRHVVVAVAPGLVAYADRNMVSVLLRQLLENAWKYTARVGGASIRVDARETDGGRSYVVSDNGAGFDMRYADRLFGAFQRIHAGREFSGIGMGLALAQRIVHKHGGRIWADAEVGQGARFYFTLGDASVDDGHGAAPCAG